MLTSLEQDRLFQLETNGVDKPLHVTRVQGREAISDLYEIRVTFACDGTLEIPAIVGQPARLTLRTGDPTRTISGIVSRLEQCGDGRRAALYQATLVPWPWLLLHRCDCRIFQASTVPEIIEAVLHAAGFSAEDGDVRFALRDSYPVREYCVQYRESDWAFVRRLMAEEGIFCFFDHEEDGDVLVLGDAPAAYPPITGEARLPFRPPLGAMEMGEHIHRFHYAEQIHPDRVVLRDYNFEKPALLLESAADAGGVLEIYDYPGDHTLPEAGDRRARLRLDGLRSRRRTADGASGCVQLSPGLVFTLTEHAHDDLNRAYLLTSVEHDGAEPLPGEPGDGEAARYENRFSCIPADVVCRPDVVPPKPSIKGVQSAMVVGPAGQEIYTDEHGRVKVQFSWDREGKRDGRSSCWMRVAQLWAGAGFGAMFIPRVGHEVLVDFLDGDPDRPIVVGSVYHGTNRPPYPLPAEKTKSTLRSSTSPGGGGSNELRFEDRAGGEEVYLHAQKDLRVAVENDEGRTIGRDRAAGIGRDDSLSVSRDRLNTIGHDERDTIGNDRILSIGHDQSTSVGNDRRIDVGNSEATTVAVNRTVDVGSDNSESVGANESVAVAANRDVSIGGAQSHTIGGDDSVAVSGNRTASVGGADTTMVDGDAAQLVGGAWNVAVGGACSVMSDGEATLASSASVTVAAPEVAVAGDTTVCLQVGGCSLSITADAVTITAGGSTVEIKDSGIAISSSSEVSVNGSKIKLN